MSETSDCYHWEQSDLVILIVVQPRASKDEIVGLHAGRLKIRITAPPIDGKANQHLIKYLAKVFGVAKSKIRITSGETGRNKQLRIVSPRIVPESIYG